MFQIIKSNENLNFRCLKLFYDFMDESEISFVMWSVVTGIIMLVTGLSYRAI